MTERCSSLVHVASWAAIFTLLLRHLVAFLHRTATCRQLFKQSVSLLSTYKTIELCFIALLRFSFESPSYILLIIKFAVFYRLYLSFACSLFPLGHPAGSECILSFDLSNISVTTNANWPNSSCGRTPPSLYVGSILVGQL